MASGARPLTGPPPPLRATALRTLPKRGHPLGPSLRNAVRIADALGLKVDDLIGEGAT
jgi:hypothetical protein